ncbi:MAG: EF-hand domain-containing protein [Burkholderiales bacterium]|nr:EF-hand domain-containing protein [Burkholderiales bacterium]
MKTLSRTLATPAVALAALLAGMACHAQTPRSVIAVPPVAAPAARTTLPNPAGLPSVLPHPAGLPDVTSPGTVAPDASAVATPAPVVGGSGASSPGREPMGAGPYTAVDLARSFISADANRDGELTRAEAQRLTIMPLGFEDMDRNKDGVVTRSEYEDSVR